MKKYALPLALSSLFVLQACNQQTPTADAPEAAASAVALETSEQRLSYGIAYGLGERMKADSVPMDVDAFTLGLRDALEVGEPRLSQEEIAAEMQAFQEKAQEAQQAAAAPRIRPVDLESVGKSRAHLATVQRPWATRPSSWRGGRATEPPCVDPDYRGTYRWRV